MLFGIRGVFLASCLVHDYFLEFLLGELFEAGALGQIASKEAVDLLVASALVGGIGVCEAGANPERLYIDMSKSPIPARDSAALVNAASYENPGNLAFEDCQCNGGAYCGNHSYLLDNSVSRGYQSVRNALGEAITVTCAYRCPRYNASVGGTSDSKHIYGHAFDFDNGEAVENWAVAKAAQRAGISAENILLYRRSGEYRSLDWLIDHEYNDTNLPPGWETYRFGHITTE